jgi:hypothetical protein
MFNHVVVRAMKEGHQDLLDLGALVESMLFYGKVSLLVDGGSATQLLRAWGPQGVLELVRRDFLELVVTDDMTGIRTDNTGTGRERYAPVTFTIREKGGGQVSLAERVFSTDAIKPFATSTNEARKIAVSLRQMTRTIDRDPALVKRVEDQLKDPSYTRTLIGDVLHHVAPNYQTPDNVVFDLDLLPDGMFRLRSNIDFAAANVEYAKRYPVEHSSLTPSMVLAFAVEVRDTLETAASLDAEITCSPLRAQLIRSTVTGALLHADAAANAIESFVDITLDDARAIREAVNSGEKSIDDILTLLEAARPFKDWLKEKSPDAPLIKEYYRAIRSESWVDRLPGKSLRWAIFTAISAVVPGGALVGLGISAADTFLLDRLVKGWKPNQFVDGPLSRFTK